MSTMSIDYPDSDKDLSITLTVAISLDDEQLPPAPGNASSSDTYDPALEISAPISAADACPIPEPTFKTKHLPPGARNMLCLRLNPPAYGSMKNWEYIACIVGMTSDEIANLQRSSNPMNALLSHLSDQPLENLITAIGQCKRIDVLVSLAKYATIFSEAHPVVPDNIPNSNGDSAVYSLCSAIHHIEQPPEKFILLTYHINKSDPEQKSLFKCYKWMEKNLVAKLNGLEVININNIDNESDFYGTVDRFFRKAKHIILFATPQYNIDIANPEVVSEDRFIKMKRYLHRQMEGEYLDNNYNNYRFRVVKPDIGPGDYLPPGWTRNTIIYNFPSGSKDLFERLNKDN
uniref:SEFIR domain-containing protein n=1 Tax=Panagrellus redivivus TaxID=6233 RepID=A0A7E4VT51_PANRE